MKKCPFCAEQIQDEAIKCRFCGSMLNEGGPAPTALAHPDHHLAEVRVLFEGSPSWKSLVGSFSLATLVSFAGVFLALFLASAPQAENRIYALAGVVIALVGAGWFLALHVRRTASRVRITNQTIDLETGLLGKQITSMQLWRVRDVDYEQSLTERILGISHIHIVSSDLEQPSLVLRGLPGSKELFLELRDAIAIARQGRNVLGIVE